MIYREIIIEGEIKKDSILLTKNNLRTEKINFEKKQLFRFNLE